MARQKSYSEQLKDPRWQRRRLEILEAARFACEQCGAEDRTLHVHHRYYEKGLSPWEYDSSTLECLCEICHEKVTALQAKVQRQIGHLSVEELTRVYGYIQAIRQYDSDDHALDCPDGEAAEGMGDAFHLDASEVVDTIYRRGQVTTLDLDTIHGVLSTRDR